ncbi:MAG: sporulation integral membrane protein YtvI [Clostridiaceae bacterium]|mgnify:CR=1 FL=1|jgi:sporulation integral membrane protein YtvI|nr:sporulation integral membrane protein YtvI [Clostridiaceae bacterium]
MPEALKKTIFSLIKILLVALGVFVLFKIGRFFIPFIIAFVFSSLIEPVVKFIETKLRISRKIGAVFSILVVFGTILTVVGLLIARLIKEIINVYSSLNLTFDSIAAFIDNVLEEASNLFLKLPVQVSDGITNAINNISSNLENLLKPVVDIATGTVKFAFSLPQALIFLLVTVLATYFMSSDKHKIVSFLDSQIPSDWLRNTRNVINNVFTALFGWLRAQLILMSVTFSEVLIGFLIIGIENALLLALIIALVDALPILGTGSILVPWAFIDLVFLGNTREGLSLALLWLITLFVRQLIEPKVVGHQIGIHPLFTLFGMYLGLQFMGVFGLFLGPICVVIIKHTMEGILKTGGLKGWVEKNFGSKESQPEEREPDSAVGEDLPEPP